jgi:hypothetical protein
LEKTSAVNSQKIKAKREGLFRSRRRIKPIVTENLIKTIAET